MSFPLLGYATEVKKSILLALALALSGSASASDVDDLIKGFSLDGMTDDSGTLCKVIKVYTGAGDIKCLKIDAPLYLVKSGIEAVLNTYKSSTLIDSNNLIKKYSFGDLEFKPQYDGFFEIHIKQDFASGNYKSIFITLESSGRYGTNLIIWNNL